MKIIRNLKENAETKSCKALRYLKGSLNKIRTKVAETLKHLGLYSGKHKTNLQTANGAGECEQSRPARVCSHPRKVCVML